MTVYRVAFRYTGWNSRARWLATESIVPGRTATREPLPAGPRPVMGIQLAPPVVGGLANLSLTRRPPDIAVHVFSDYDLFRAVLLLRLSAWIRQPASSASYWSFSFGVTALPTMAILVAERGDSRPMAWAGGILFVCANLVIAYLVVCASRLLTQGKLVSRPASTTAASGAVSPRKRTPAQRSVSGCLLRASAGTRADPNVSSGSLRARLPGPCRGATPLCNSAVFVVSI